MMNEAQQVEQAYAAALNGTPGPITSNSMVIHDLEIDADQNVVRIWTTVHDENEPTFVIVNPPLEIRYGGNALDSLTRLIAGAIQ